MPSVTRGKRPFAPSHSARSLKANTPPTGLTPGIRPYARCQPLDPPSHQARRRSCSSIGAPARAHLPQRHRLHLRHVLHARTRGRCKKTLVIQNSHTLLIVSAGKTPPTCDEIVDLRHSACGHNKWCGAFSVQQLTGRPGSISLVGNVYSFLVFYNYGCGTCNLQSPGMYCPSLSLSFSLSPPTARSGLIEEWRKNQE